MASFNKMYQDGVSGMYHRDTDCEHRLPSAIIIGSTSTGITTFASFLGLHPQVCTCIINELMSVNETAVHINTLPWDLSIQSRMT